jgi:hypothetical protein
LPSTGRIARADSCLANALEAARIGENTNKWPPTEPKQADEALLGSLYPLSPASLPPLLLLAAITTNRWHFFFFFFKGPFYLLAKAIRLLALH